MKLDYKKKAESYENLSNYIKKHENFNNTNSWGCHYYTNLFYKYAIKCSEIIKCYLQPTDIEHLNHQSISEKFKEYIDPKFNTKIGAGYHTLFILSRKFRYEQNKLSKQQRKDFENTMKKMDEYLKTIKSKLNK
ncbi:hypothetical protein [Marinitoga sp. 1155]|uniref:hypothetical protein n=1 Tax=Marinitoga sp. 1155 TaxID=1428448 RepID=UPI000640F6A1|nr:hypothetical protein [Marinitoga sp. 1155]AJW77010.1 hypothetical protein UF09_44 [Marinitoga camini virus 2]KLO24828.1 hypothetical protein X274_02490 [Marinitoga sp. 1155]